MKSSTPREQLDLYASQHADDLKKSRKFGIYSSWLWVTVLALQVVLHFYYDGKNVFFFLLIIFPFIYFFERSLKRKNKWLEKFSCPKCHKSLSHFLTEYEYFKDNKNQPSLPDSVKKCPYCHLSFDEPFDLDENI